MECWLSKGRCTACCIFLLFDCFRTAVLLQRAVDMLGRRGRLWHSWHFRFGVGWQMHCCWFVGAGRGTQPCLCSAVDGVGAVPRQGPGRLVVWLLQHLLSSVVAVTEGEQVCISCGRWSLWCRLQKLHLKSTAGALSHADEAVMHTWPSGPPLCSTHTVTGNPSCCGGACSTWTAEGSRVCLYSMNETAVLSTRGLASKSRAKVHVAPGTLLPVTVTF